MRQAVSTKDHGMSIGTLDWDSCKTCLFSIKSGCAIEEKKFIELLLYDHEQVYCMGYKRDTRLEEDTT